MPEAIPTSGDDSLQSPAACYQCGAELNGQAPDVCLVCGRRQTRQCFCGTTMPRGPLVCPTCGADWRRIRRGPRSSRTRLNGRDLAANAVIGGLIAVALAALLYFLAAGGGRSLAATVSSALSGAWPKIRGAMTQAAAPLAVFALGCFAGVARYCYSLRARRRGHRRTLPRKRSNGAG